MNRLFPFLTLLAFAISGFAQPKLLKLPENLKHKYVPVDKTATRTTIFPYQSNNLTVKSESYYEDIGYTYFDRQSECSAVSGRLNYFYDGSMSSVWTMGNDTISFDDIGTGYAYFDGNNWSDAPFERIESIKTMNPVIDRLSAGEIIISEKVPPGSLHVCKRPLKGSGAWSESEIPLPGGVSGLTHSRMLTTGPDHTSVHVLSLTWPVSEGGTEYLGQDGALVYQRSSDSGETWDISEVIPGTDSMFYNGFSPDTYALAWSYDNQLAFVVADPWSDLFLMKSVDNGTSWQKTVIWEHPISKWHGQATDTIDCPDGTVTLTFDRYGKVHVVFGLTRLFSDGNSVYRFPFIGGLAEWDENKPVWTGGNQYNCLNIDTLYSSGDLIASPYIDFDGNGSWDILGNFGDYNSGPMSQPQLAFNGNGIGVLIMSSVVENFNNGLQDYRHILGFWLTDDGFKSWLSDLNEDPVYTFSECVFPSLARQSSDYDWNFIYQEDQQPGMAAGDEQDAFGVNNIKADKVPCLIPSPFTIITLLANPPDGGYLEGAGMISYGDTAVIKAHVYPGYKFVDWRDMSGNLFSEDSVCQFIAYYSNTLTANFRLIESLPETLNLRLTVYPNPAHNYLMIESPKALNGEDYHAGLYQLTGESLREWNNTFSPKVKLDLSGISPGIYLLKIHDRNGKSYRTKVVIQ